LKAICSVYCMRLIWFTYIIKFCNTSLYICIYIYKSPHQSIPILPQWHLLYLVTLIRAVERYETHAYQTKKTKDSPYQMVHAGIFSNNTLYLIIIAAVKMGESITKPSHYFPQWIHVGIFKKGSTTWPGTKIASKQNCTILTWNPNDLFVWMSTLQNKSEIPIKTRVIWVSEYIINVMILGIRKSSWNCSSPESVTFVLRFLMRRLFCKWCAV